MDLFELPPVLFVVDTDHHAGNFERELCAYVTGQVGDYEPNTMVSDEFDKFCDELPGQDPFRDLVKLTKMSTGTHEPCMIWPTPGFVSDGSGRVYPTEEAPAFEQCYQDRHWPVYQSVAIFLEEMPPRKLVDLMVKRSKAFCKGIDWSGRNREIGIKKIRFVRPSVTQELLCEC